MLILAFFAIKAFGIEREELFQDFVSLSISLLSPSFSFLFFALKATFCHRVGRSLPRYRSHSRRSLNRRRTNRSQRGERTPAQVGADAGSQSRENLAEQKVNRACHFALKAEPVRQAYPAEFFLLLHNYVVCTHKLLIRPDPNYLNGWIQFLVLLGVWIRLRFLSGLRIRIRLASIIYGAISFFNIFEYHYSGEQTKY